MGRFLKLEVATNYAKPLGDQKTVTAEHLTRGKAMFPKVSIDNLILYLQGSFFQPIAMKREG